ncbi:branched-chain amino acid aminotransferase II [Xylona heveae TC161]|uniref:Branched-chain-amino-acid aminotransferase n=1 Tax=Xylona heveae (strain CBS 132557 / TC161) TaxID=1328760 RepID=A0A165IEC6_XYLHT|nr:branched-chain amino acid aminotransferase II [Xylona heveae TC161]KZF24775.1 branched-chain amino acid aminotransferase II [Xylona heveae TC161]
MTVSSPHTPLRTLNASKLKIQYTTQPKPVPASDAPEVISHSACTDHMLVARWDDASGWADPEIVPHGGLTLMLTASVLHYATACFEGMKVHRGVDGKLRLFRPWLNCERMLKSSQRISLPSVDPAELLKLVRALCTVDGPKWLPKDTARGSGLYIRPTLIGTDHSLGFQVPQEALLFVVISYWAAPGQNELSISSTRAKPAPRGLRLYASPEDTVRAWPGGTGAAKLSANYGPTLMSHAQAKKLEYDQVLWLFGPECQITEAGSSNFFVIWRTQEDKLQLVTAALHDQLILPGVTRQSILELARERFATTKQNAHGDHIEALEVLEGKLSMFDIIAAAEEERLLAAFSVGTAAFVTPVSQILFRGQPIDINEAAVPHVDALRGWMTDIMYGKEISPWVDEVSED